MTKSKRLLAFALSLAISTAWILPIQAVDPNAESFSSFLIDADTADFPTQSLQVELYRRNDGGGFRPDDTVRYSCQVNRVAGDANFFIQPTTDNVWVEVDYLTDLNGDGIYEMLDGENAPVSDSMSTSGTLAALNGADTLLTNGQTYILSAQTLTDRGQAVLKARNTPNDGQSITDTAGSLPDPDTILYLVTLRYHSAVDQEEYELCYYLRIFEHVIIPSDVKAGSWYYSAVEYALEQGYLSTTGSDSFSPNAAVTRSQLAQILWRLGGSQTAQGAGLSDVSASDWYFNAANWCYEQGLMSSTGSGFGPSQTLTREQLALILRHYAQFSGLSVDTTQDLSQFADGAKVSPWAADGLAWCVGAGVLGGYEDGTLRPGNGISRAELSAVLRTFSTLLQGSNDP